VTETSDRPVAQRLKLVVALCVVALAGWTLAAGSSLLVHAATFTVNDFGDGAPSPSNCGSGTGTCTLRAAVMEADAAGTPSVITLSAGTYALSIAKTGTDDASEGDLDITKDVTINGAGQASTIIDGTAMKTNEGQDRIFKVASGGTLTISGVTIRNGTTPNVTGTPGGDGGGILSIGTLNVTDSIISGNTAIHRGGGLAQQGSGVAATATLTRVTVTNNTALASAGGSGEAGGIEQGGSGAFNSTVNIINSHIDGNTAESFGGGVIEDSGGTVNITNNSTVSGNKAHNAKNSGDVGGVYETGAGTVNISNSVIDGNSTDSQAGGVDEDGAGSLHMSNVVVSNNTAGDSAGGIYLDGGSGCGAGCGTVTLDHLTISGNKVLSTSGSTSDFLGSGGGLNEDGGDVFSLTNSTVSNNTGSHGAGILLDGGSVGASGAPGVTITNVTISNNTATALGNGRINDGFGAGVLGESGDNVALVNVTISNNQASGRGGGLINNLRASQNAGVGRVTLLNTTISDNTAGTGAGDLDNDIATANGGGVYVKSSIVSGGSPVNCGGRVLPVSQGYNIDSGTSCGFGAAGDQGSKDPKIGPLADNGGGLQTRGLQPGSPALDAIPGGVCPPPDSDERGVSRHTDACDVGAFEGVLAAAVAPTVAPPRALARAGASGGIPGSNGLAILWLGVLVTVTAAGLLGRRRLRRESG
jgi:hypothetical protein